LAQTKKSSWPLWRRLIQLGFLLFFLVLFALTVFPLSVKFPPVNLLMRLDPLAGLVAMLSARTWIPLFLPALFIILVTILFGRLFCGYVCPMGSSLDFTRLLFFRKTPRRKSLPLSRRTKYYVLIAFLAAALLGFSLSWVLDPLALFLRTLTFLVYPVVLLLLNLGVTLLAPVSEKLGMLDLAYASFRPFSFATGFLSATVFGIILYLEYLRPRFWCTRLCPLGAFLGLCSLGPLFRRRVKPEHRICRACEVACRGEAISAKTHAAETADCLVCGECLAFCKEDAVRFGFGRPARPTALNLERRKFLGAVAAGAGFLVLSKADPWPKTRPVRYVRPPGALPEDQFLDRCLRCGVCLKACLTNALQPTGFETGWERLYTPRLVPRVGGCERNCNLCGQTCPSGAIRPLDLEEKSFAKMGTAAILKERCLAWEQNKLCLICAEVCPFHAIDFHEVTDPEGTFRKPFVEEELCTGCGLCEEKCPVTGDSAIIVYAIGEERFARGSYITEEKKARREAAVREVVLPAPAPQDSTLSLPPGFLP